MSGPVLQLWYAQIWDFYSRVFCKCQKKLDWGLCKHHLAYLIRKASLPADTEVPQRCRSGRLALLLARDCPKTPWLRMRVVGHPTAYANLPCVWMTDSSSWAQETSRNRTSAASSKDKRSGETCSLRKCPSAGQWPSPEGKHQTQMSLLLYPWHTFLKSSILGNITSSAGVKHLALIKKPSTATSNICTSSIAESSKSFKWHRMRF